MFRATLPQGASRRLIVAFVLLLLLPAVAVVWLGVRLIIQDRQLESAQLQEQRENVAERVVSRLSERLSAAQRNLASETPPGDDVVTLVFEPHSVETRPSAGLLFYPGIAVGSGDLLPEFATGEEMQHRRNDLDAAEAAYRQLSADRVAAVRAGALVRLARVLRKKGTPERALRVYDDLARPRDTLADGIPAVLAARRARCVVLDGLKQAERLRKGATALREGLLAGTWKIDRGTFTQYQEELATWLGSPAAPRPAQRAAAEAAEWLWERRGTAGRTAMRLGGIDLTLLWQSSGGTTRGLVAGPEFQKREWFSAVPTGSADSGVQVVEGILCPLRPDIARAHEAAKGLNDLDVEQVRRMSAMNPARCESGSSLTCSQHGRMCCTRQTGPGPLGTPIRQSA